MPTRDTNLEGNTSASSRGLPIVTPNPDPTVLTTAALIREIATAREVVEAELKGLRGILETRLAGMDKAIELLQLQTDKFPNSVEVIVKQLRELHDERFHSIATQFSERDTRTEQTSRDSKVAVDAALQAAKEAVSENNKANAIAMSKSEAAFTKQIDQIAVLISTGTKATDDKIDDLKSRQSVFESRLQASEAQKKGNAETRDNFSNLTGLLIAGGVLLATVVAIAVSIAAGMVLHH